MGNRTLILSLCLGAVGFTSANAATVAHYRFEDGAFLTDSSGNGLTLSTNGTSPSAASTDFGVVDFPTTIPVSGASNTGYANFVGTSNALTAADSALFTNPTSFTIEAFVTFTAGADLQNVAAQWTDGSNSQRSFRFGINNANKINLGLYDGGTTNFDSAFTLTSGDDYYIAATFIDNGANADLAIYAKNLTTGAAMVSDTTTITFGTLNNSPQPFSIGAYSGTTKPFDGAIDEVRLSNAVLSQSEFLIAIPEPSMSVALLGGAVFSLCMVRRRRG